MLSPAMGIVRPEWSRSYRAKSCVVEPKSGIGERPCLKCDQNYALYPHMTAYDNLAYGLRRAGMSTRCSSHSDNLVSLFTLIKPTQSIRFKFISNTLTRTSETPDRVFGLPTGRGAGGSQARFLGQGLGQLAFEQALGALNRSFQRSHGFTPRHEVSNLFAGLLAFAKIGSERRVTCEKC